MNPVENSVEGEKRLRTFFEIFFFCFILLVGFGSRFWLVDLPNFKPIAAMVLFGGFLFRHWSLPVVAMLVVMLASDLVFGGYEFWMAFAVYFSLAISAFLGIWIQRNCRTENGLPCLGFSAAGKFLVASLSMSTCFYLLTNFAVWFAGGWYDFTAGGLIKCYAAAIPFYRMTLSGDLVFTAGLVSVYSLVLFGLRQVQSKPSEAESLLS
ncbi:MAG: DUF6580 family putative transport protein [Planctomycetota bacterium]